MACKIKTKQFKWLAATLMLVAAMVMPSTAWAQGSITPSKPSNGDGSVASPYQIGTAAELYWFAGLVNGDTNVCNFNADTNPTGTQQNKAACAVLTANIVVNSGLAEGKTMLGSLEYDTSGKVTNGSNFVAWTPIGFNYQNYTGTFDGKGYTVSGLYFNDTSQERVGLFGRVDGGKISNVGVLDSYFEFKHYGGGVCGYNCGGQILNSYNNGIVSGNSFTGGVCGDNYVGKILNSYNNGIVSGNTNTGGVCGYNQSNGEITNCYNSGTVSGTGYSKQIAGVCGYNDSKCTISGCYNTGAVSGNNSGGVCYKNQGTIKNCYNTGTVSGQTICGGVCGSNTAGTVTSCYNRGAVNGPGSYFGGICGTTGTTSSTINCYYDSDIYSGNAIGYYPDGTVGEDVMGKTTAQFKSGEVAWLLNGSTSAGNSLAWYQNIDNGTADSYPLLDSNGHGKVYPCTPCTGVYSNSVDTQKDHEYPTEFDGNGFMKCSHCEATQYQPATQNTSGQYEICNAGQLYWFAQEVNGGKTGINAVLTANITVNSGVLKADGSIADDVSGFRSWTPIGFNYQKKYTGTFDGKGYTVSGLYFNDSSIDYVGFFGCSCGTIQNVGVVDSYFNGADFIGGVCGKDDNGTIMNCYNTGTISGNYYVGGVCGENHAEIEYEAATATISNCYNTGAINGNWYVGGVCGQNKATSNGEFGDITAIITNCFNTGPVNDGRGVNVGGLCGYNEAISSKGATVTATIENCIYCSETYKGMWGANGGSASIENVAEKTEAKFKSGEVAYLLNKGDTDGTQTWYQDLTAETGDIHPVLTKTNSNTVYQVKLYCGGGIVDAGMTYANNTEAVTKDHNMPETASFNSKKKIFEKLCQTEGCGKIDYYADAAGTISATANDNATAFTVANYPLQDATTYDSQAVFTASSLSYTRTFADNDYNCLYVPFEAPVSAFNDCSIYAINMFQQHDTNNDGVVDDITLEVIKAPEGAVIKANHPYIIKSEQTGEQTFTITDAAFAAAVTPDFKCSSMNTDFVFRGSYTDAAPSAEEYYTLVYDKDKGKVVLGTSTNGVGAQRWYMTMTSRDSQFGSVSDSSNVKAINIVVSGEDEDATGIVNAVFGGNLNGKFLEKGKIIIVRNGRKYNTNGQIIK